MELKYKLIETQREGQTGVIKTATVEISLFKEEKLCNRKISTVVLKPKKPTTKSFVPFKKLTNEQVLDWCKNQYRSEFKKHETELIRAYELNNIDINDPILVEGLPEEKSVPNPKSKNPFKK